MLLSAHENIVLYVQPEDVVSEFVDFLCLFQMEKQRLKEEREKHQQEERTKFIEKPKNLLIFDSVVEDKPKKSSAGPGRVIFLISH